MINPSKEPVLLIHGIFRKQTVFNRMAAYLQEQGWEVHRFDLKPNNATKGLDELAYQIENYVERNFEPSQKINLVGLSMGGLVSRYYVQRLGGAKRVERFITISSPHNGTWMAYLLPLKACQQMRPNSDFLQDLNSDLEALKQVQFTSIWTPYDFVIVPGSSSQVGIGIEKKLSIFAHFMMVRHDQSLKAVTTALSQANTNS
jgi:triacylglycerol lipase